MNQEEQQKWKIRIRELAEEAGFVKAGFTHSEPIEGLEPFLKRRREAGYHTSFEEKELIRRVDARQVWDVCETVVVLAYPLPLTCPPQEKEGRIVRSAVGEDYHRVVEKALAKLIEGMKDAGWPYEKPRTQVDTGPLNERAFALRSGLGWIGRNQQLIIPGIGSFVALALMLLDQKIPPDSPIENQCGACKKCSEACPAQIIGQDEFAANQCLSYVTQSKEQLTEEQICRLGGRIFGCDTCQEACPHNRLWLKREAEQGPASGIPRGIDLWEVLNLTKGQFNQKLKPTAAGWRGKGILQRNAYFALKYQKDPRLEAWERARSKEGAIPPSIQPYIKANKKE